MKYVGTILLGFIIGWFTHIFFAKEKVVTQTVEKIVYNPPEKSLTIENTSIPLPTLTSQQSSKQLDKYSPEYLMSKAIQEVNTANYKQALAYLTDIISQVQYTYSTQELQKIFITLVKKILAQHPQPTTQIELLYGFINTLPNALELRFLIAKQLVNIKNYEEAKYQASFLENNQNWLAQFETINKQINYAQLFTGKHISIALIKKHNAWHINAVINNHNVVLILDTGAMMTTISQEFLNTTTHQDIIMSTANGKTNAKIYTDNTLQIGEITEQNVKIVGLPKNKLPNNIDGLLGMDWLSRFHFIIDAEHHTLQLTKK